MSVYGDIKRIHCIIDLFSFGWLLWLCHVNTRRSQSTMVGSKL